MDIHHDMLISLFETPFNHFKVTFIFLASWPHPDSALQVESRISTNLCAQLALISKFDNFSNFSTVWWFCVYCKVSFYYKDYKVRTASHLLGRVVMADKVRALKEDGDENSSTFYIFWIKLTLCSVLSLSPSLWILAYFAISSLWYQPWNLTIQPRCPLLLMHPPCNLHESASACALLSSEHASRQSRKRRTNWINILREHSVLPLLLPTPRACSSRTLVANQKVWNISPWAFIRKFSQQYWTKSDEYWWVFASQQYGWGTTG